MTDIDLIIRAFVALAIGFLMGLQREYAYGGEGKTIIAGERTFALLGLSGFLAAMIAELFDSAWIMVSLIFVIGILVTAGHFVNMWNRERAGITTEVAIMIVMLVGALSFLDHLILAAAVGISTTVVLSIKLETDRLVTALTSEDVSAVLQMAIITAIVLPILPNQSFWPAPFDVLNPFKIWLMVVFISGISFLGYVLIKIVGPQRAISLTGLLGGLVSSTAVTLSLSERSKKGGTLDKRFALAITLAWTVMFLRILIEVGVLNVLLLSVVWIPVASAGGVGLLYCLYLYLSQRSSGQDEMEFSNPFDLASALKFGILYGIVLLISRSAQVFYGDTGILVSSIFAGLADVNAITLSMAELSKSESLSLEVASRAIVFAAMSNTVVKGGIVLFTGAPGLRRAILPGLILVLITGIGVASYI